MKNAEANIIHNLEHEAMQKHGIIGEYRSSHALGALSFLAYEAAQGNKWAINRILDLSKTVAARAEYIINLNSIA